MFYSILALLIKLFKKSIYHAPKKCSVLFLTLQSRSIFLLLMALQRAAFMVHQNMEDVVW